MMTKSPPELTPPSPFSRLIGIAGVLLTHSIALLFVLIAMVKIVPTYVVVFDQHDISLPVATQKIVIWSEFCVAYWYLVFFFGMVVDTMIVLVFALVTGRHPRILSAYSHGCLLTACAVLVYVGAWLSHGVHSFAR